MDPPQALRREGPQRYPVDRTFNQKRMSDTREASGFLTEKQTMQLKTGALLTLALLIISLGFVYQGAIFDYLLASIESIRQSGILGMVLYIIAMGTASLFMIPTTLGSIVAGAIFTPLPLAVLVVLLASQVGIVLAFLLGRTVLRPTLFTTISN